MEGENYPPMHPRCRSTTVPYEYSDVFSDEPEKEDFENNENEGIINNNGTVFYIIL